MEKTWIISTLSKKAYILIGFFIVFYSQMYGQSRSYIDSLEQIYIDDQYDPHNKLKILRELAGNHPDPDKKLNFSENLIKASQELNSLDFLFIGFVQKGEALRIKGDLSEALRNFFKAAEIAAKEKTNYNSGLVGIAIADTYSIMGNHESAVTYYKEAIAIHRANDSILLLASALENLGDEFLIVSKPDSALIMFRESGPLFKHLGYMEGIATNIGNMGITYALQGKDELAKDNMSHAIAMFEEMEDYYPISIYLTYMSDLYLNKNNWKAALSYSERSLVLAQKYGLKDQISEANLQLSKLYEQSGDIAESFKYYKNYTVYKDSVNNIVSVQQMANIRTDFEVAQKQIEVDLLSQEKRNQRIIVFATAMALILIGLLAIGLFRRNKFIRKTSAIIENQKKQSDKLLLNILPEETAEELKESGKVKAKKFESVSVLFSDFIGFTRKSEHLSPEALVESVDFYYSKFDDIMKKHGLEKIKTVGDAYMAAGGLPLPLEDHACKMICAAFDMLDFVIYAKKLDPSGQTRFDVRIGINTGPVVAGVVGKRKFAYDIWGDTVNIASRMESNSVAGKINISENTYLLIKDKFECAYRGEIDAKNKGLMKMYFVNHSIV